MATTELILLDDKMMSVKAVSHLGTAVVGDLYPMSLKIDVLLTSKVEAGGGPGDDAHGQGLECLVGPLLPDDLLKDLLGKPGAWVLLLHWRLCRSWACALHL